MNTHKLLVDLMSRVFDAHPFGAWVVSTPDLARDISSMKPGAILVASGSSEVRFIPASECITLGCIAGWISDEDNP